MPQGEGDLLGQDLKKSHRLLAQIVTKVDHIHPGGNKIAGVKEAAGPVNKIDHLLPGRDGLRTDVLKAPLTA
jgi:hypothetical protein